MTEQGGNGLQRCATALTQTQRAALDLLLTGKTVTETAAALGVDRSTVSRWLHRQPAFRNSLRQRREELSQAVQARLEALALKAVEVINGLLDDANSRVRLGAAKTVFSVLQPGTAAMAVHGPPGGLPDPSSYTGEAEAGVIMPPPDMTPQEREIVRVLLRRMTDAAWAVRKHGVDTAQVYLDATEARQRTPERPM